jgi:hypothetical protein
MQVTVIAANKNKKYTVLLKQGVQSFRLDYQGTKRDCLWYAKMFRKALANHDAEQPKGIA